MMADWYHTKCYCVRMSAGCDREFEVWHACHLRKYTRALWKWQNMECICIFKWDIIRLRIRHAGSCRQYASYGMNRYLMTENSLFGRFMLISTTLRHMVWVLQCIYSAMRLNLPSMTSCIFSTNERCPIYGIQMEPYYTNQPDNCWY